jgi:hypothetical protein
MATATCPTTCRTRRRGSPGNPGDVVIVETFYEWELFTPFINHMLSVHGTPSSPNFLSNHGDNKRLITGVAVFMNEPFNPAAGGGGN